MDVKDELWRKLSAKELMLLNWCWRRLLRIPWTARRSNQSLLKKINPEYSLEGLMLKLHYLDVLMQRTDSLEKTLMLEKIKGRRRRGRQRCDGWMASLTQWTWVWANSRGWWWTGRPGMLQFRGLQRVRHYWAELNLITGGMIDYNIGLWLIHLPGGGWCGSESSLIIGLFLNLRASQGAQ